VLQLLRFEQASDLLPERAAKTSAALPTLVEALTEHMAALYTDKSPEAILLESLPARLSLAQVLAKADYGGWNGETWRAAGADRAWACAPIGLLDDLARRAQPPLCVNFAQNGHFLAIGAPASGKTTLLRTIALALAHLFTPEEAALYIVSFGGRSLDALARLPHVGAVIGNDERERLSRLLRYLLSALEKRRYALASLHAADLETYNRRRSDDQPLLPALFVLVDNFAELWRTLESDSDEAADWLRLLRDGRAVGIHFALTAPSLSLPYNVLNLIEVRFALRLPERGDYLQFLGRLPERESDPRPGSGILQADRRFTRRSHCPTLPPTMTSATARCWRRSKPCAPHGLGDRRPSRSAPCLRACRSTYLARCNICRLAMRSLMRRSLSHCAVGSALKATFCSRSRCIGATRRIG
jgi:DNA segregation ATPase FtsK/SpoIIIE-like protein